MAWVLHQQHPHTLDWEHRTEGFVEALSRELDRTGCTSRWGEKDVFAVLKTLPRDNVFDAFWQELEQSSSLEDLIRRLGISGDELEKAQIKLEQLKEEVRKRKKLVEVCGKEFDSSEDNLSQLWTHVQAGIPDQALATFEPVDVRKLESFDEYC